MHLYGSQGPWLHIISLWISLLQAAPHRLEGVHAVPFIYINGAQEARRAWTKSNCLLCCNECLWVACLHSAVGQCKLLQNDVAWCCNDSHKPGLFSIAKRHVSGTGNEREVPKLCQSWWMLRFAHKGSERISQVSLFVQSQIETGGHLSGKAQHSSSTNCKARVSQD